MIYFLEFFSKFSWLNNCHSTMWMCSIKHTTFHADLHCKIVFEPPMATISPMAKTGAYILRDSFPPLFSLLQLSTGFDFICFYSRQAPRGEGVGRFSDWITCVSLIGPISIHPSANDTPQASIEAPWVPGSQSPTSAVAYWWDRWVEGKWHQSAWKVRFAIMASQWVALSVTAYQSHVKK